MVEFINAFGMEILGLILGIIATVLGVVFKNIAKDLKNDKIKAAIAETVVLFVEQVYKNLHGKQKLQAALDRAAELLAEKGIKFSALEMESLIEASVAKFNQVFKQKEITG